jgi:hypothetical protein
MRDALRSSLLLVSTTSVAPNVRASLRCRAYSKLVSSKCPQTRGAYASTPLRVKKMVCRKTRFGASESAPAEEKLKDAAL